LAKEAEKDPQFAEIWASQQAFMQQYKQWKALAYLPRDFDEDAD
jgi:TRAP-type mannitol/chloroaromatic compound transport system substrate-binding protein